MRKSPKYEDNVTDVLHTLRILCLLYIDITVNYIKKSPLLVQKLIKHKILSKHKNTYSVTDTFERQSLTRLSHFEDSCRWWLNPGSSLFVRDVKHSGHINFFFLTCSLKILVMKCWRTHRIIPHSLVSSPSAETSTQQVYTRGLFETTQ